MSTPATDPPSDDDKTSDGFRQTIEDDSVRFPVPNQRTRRLTDWMDDPQTSDSTSLAVEEPTPTPSEPDPFLYLSPFECLMRLHSPFLQTLLRVKRQDAASPVIAAFYEKKSTRFLGGGPTNKHQKVMASMFCEDAKEQFDQHLKRHLKENGITLMNFLDLGAAPGGWSRWLLGVNEKVKGIGVELPLGTAGGRQVFVGGSDYGQKERYKVVRADLLKTLEKRTALGGRLPSSMEIVLAGALPNEVPRNSPEAKALHVSPIALLTTLNQLYIAFVYLKPNGVLIATAWKKSFLINSEIILLLRDSFKEIITGPGSRPFYHRSTYQLMALGFDATKRTDVLRRIEGAIKTLEGFPREHKAKDNGVLIFVGQTEEEIFEKNRAWLLQFYEPLWTFQSEAILQKQRKLESEQQENHRSESESGRSS